MSATDTITSAPNGATDTANSLLGNRKGADAKPGELAPTSGTGVPANTNDAANAVKKDKDKDSSLRIHIELDLDVEVHLTARVKGDITIGLL